MKTKLALILIVIGIAASLGATKITKADKASNEITQNTSTPKNVGGFVSEDH